MVDFTCDLKCPPLPDSYPGIKYCCWGCEKATQQGCSVPRDQRSEGGNGYDCKKYCFIVGFVWDGSKWTTKHLCGIPIDNADKEFVAAYNDLMKGAQDRENGRTR